MTTDFLSRRLLPLARTVADGRLARLSSTQTGGLLVVGITVPILVVLAVWLGSALGLPLVLSQVVATTLALGLVTPSMLRVMLSSTLIETGETRYTAQTNPAEDVLNFFAGQDYEGWSGLMANFDLAELEFLSELVGEYLEGNDDLSHREYGFAKSLLEKIDEELA